MTAVYSDTSADIAFGFDGVNLPGIVTPVVYGILTSGELHHAAWPVTAVSGNQVTWTNTGRVDIPPRKNITTGAVKVLSSVVSWPASAFLNPDGEVDSDNIGFWGTGTSTSSVCFDNRSDSLRGYGGDARLGSGVGVHGFGYGIQAIGGRFSAVAASFGGQRTRAVNCDLGVSGDLTSANIMGVNGIAVLLAGHSNVRGSGARLGNCRLQALRKESGAGGWWDFAHVVSTGAGGVLYVGGVTGHLVGSRVIRTAGPGVQGQNGGFGRGSGALVLCVKSYGWSFANGTWEANQSISSGCEAAGLQNNRGRFSMIGGGLTGNKTRGGHTLDLGVTTLDDSNVTQNISTGLRGEGGSNTRARHCALGPNGATQEIYAQTGAIITIDSSTGYTTTFPAVTNKIGSDGTVIYKAGDPVPAAPVFYTYSAAPGLITVPANSSATFDVAVTGILANASKQVFSVNCNGAVDSAIDMRAQQHLSTPGVVTIVLRNSSGSAINLNRTWSVLATVWS